MRCGRTITKWRRGTRCRCSAPCVPPIAASAARRSRRRSPQKVFAANPKHPGAAHFIIHAFDDPDHAPLALPAARSYAGIAPSAAHALHMPSHIFVQLGMWDDVRTSNIAAYKAADRAQRADEARRRPRGLPHARLAAVRQPDAGQHRRGEAERRVGEAGRRSQSRQRRHSQRLPRHARAADSRDREVGKIALDAPARTRCTPIPRTPACRAWRCRLRRQQHLDLHRRLQRGEARRSARPPKPRKRSCAARARSSKPARIPSTPSPSRSWRSRSARSSATPAARRTRP